MAPAVAASTGARRQAVSRYNSVAVPPAPTLTMAPNTGSNSPPTMISTPGGAIGVTSTPCNTAAGAWVRRAACMASQAASSAASSRSPSATAPASVLCGRSRDCAFSASG